MNHNTFIAAIFLLALLLLFVLNIYDLAGGTVTLSGVFELLIGVATIIGAIAAIIGAVAARNALSTWKKQRDAELAKSLAASLYQYRLSLHRIRFPYLLPEDNHSAELENGVSEVNDEIRLQRWRRSRLQLQEVQALLAEADLHWPKLATHAFKDVLDVERELAIGIRSHNTLNIRQQHDNSRSIANSMTEETWTEEFGKRTAEVLRLNGLLIGFKDENDEVSEKIDASFRTIEKFLRDRI